MQRFVNRQIKKWIFKEVCNGWLKNIITIVIKYLQINRILALNNP